MTTSYLHDLLISDLALRRLLTNAMRLVLFHAKSEKGFFILNREIDLFKKITPEITADSLFCAKSFPIKNELDLPTAISPKMIEEINSLLDAPGSQGKNFEQKTLIWQWGSTSIVCKMLPVNERIIGILYLEMQSASNLIPVEIMGLFDAVISQLLISFENEIFQLHQMQLLREKMNPHFLFNALSSIAELCSERPESAETAIVKLSSLYRNILTTEISVGTLDMELEIIQRYLFIEKLRFGDKLSWRIELQGDPKSVALPPLLLQPLVENSVKHGISASSSGQNRIDITIKAQISEKNCRIIITDNGVGFSPTNSGAGFGLKSVQDSLKYFFKDNYSFEISHVNGVSVSITIPVFSALEG
jgi:hypothetical protein